ncbi:hypothetical protein [Brachyspira sp. SAP_772]|uniref:hypothetical protein n=1 Tax=Brachyspira sp. SAP_772 TaxID=2608385 RepID=UPI0012F51039|nr:hypothetical protein [Brachyspira sp. SAP_772]
MKKLQYVLICISVFTIVACSSKNNDITNPINNDNNSKTLTTSYTINGIDEKYSGTWKFFNADDTGNVAVDVNVIEGGVSGLVISNSKAKNNTVNFTKNNIYSKPKKEDNQYYDRYFGYIISDGTWVGEIHFPIYDDETVGYVYVTNKKTSDIIIGMIDKAPADKEGIEVSFQGTFNADNNRSVNITKDFVVYLENGVAKAKIPSSFLELSRDDKNNLGYAVFYGPLYSGVFINTSNNKISDPVNQLIFVYIDYNNKLEITLKEDGTPISAKYNKKTTTISPDNLTYTK